MLMKNSSNNIWHQNGQFDNGPQVATTQLNEEMRKTANELLDSMQDSRFSETEVCFSDSSFFFVLFINSD